MLLFSVPCSCARLNSTLRMPYFRDYEIPKLHPLREGFVIYS